MYKFDPRMAGRLDVPERRLWHDPAKIIPLLHVEPGMTCVDVGAGTGYFTLPLAAAVGATGKVYALDVSEEMLDRLRARLDGIENVIPLLSGEARLPLSDGIADLVWMASVFHELSDRATSLQEALRVLRPGGMLAVLDWHPEAPEGEAGPPIAHRVAPAAVLAALQAAGFSRVAPVAAAAFPYHYLITGTKP